MSLLLFYTLLFGTICYFTKDKKHKFIFCGIVLIYLLSSLAACYIYAYNPRFSYIKLDFFAIIFHGCCLYLLIKPFSNYDKIKFMPVEPLKGVSLSVLTILVVGVNIVAYNEILPQVSIYSILNESQELRVLYDDNSGHSSYLSFFAIKYWTIPLVLAFIYMVVYPQKKFLIYLLIICSLAYVLDGLRFAGRECLLKYSFIFVIFAYLFYNKINDTWRKSMRRIIVAGAVIVVFFFSIITIMRFSQENVIGQSSDTISSIFSYFGQGFVYFSEIFVNIPNGLKGGSGHFPFFFGYSSQSQDVNLGFDLTTFSTAVGTWIKDGGILFAFIITLIYNRIFKLFGSIRLTVFTLFYISWAYDFIFSALFFYNDTINGSRVISLMFIIFLDFLFGNRKFSQ